MITTLLLVIVAVVALAWLVRSMMPAMQVGHCYRITGMYRGAPQFVEIPCPDSAL